MKTLKLHKIITKKFFEIGGNPCGASLLYDESDKFFREVAKMWLKQKPLELNYLTEQETKMTEKEVNLQVALGLKSCKTLDDVCQLLNDVRVYERLKLLEGLKIK